MKKIFFKGAWGFLISLFLSCSGSFDINKFSPASDSITATHSGWTSIIAVGAKTPVAQASDLSTSNAYVTLSWGALVPSSGSVMSYNIYRSSSSGGQSAASPLATNISSTANTYTDTSVTGGQTYYYTIAAVINGTVVIPTITSDSEVKVIVPPDNLVLLHRWAANMEICAQMGKTSDRTNNYRCSVQTGVNAPPGTGGSGYVDLGSSIFVDRFEQGCNYTYSATVNKCGSANGCIGILTTPNAIVTGNLNDVYYSRLNGTCYINTNGGTAWTAANSATLAQRQAMASPAPGLPPFVLIDQLKSQGICTGQTLSGFAGTKRLLKRREQVLVAAWNSSLDDTTIDTMENGVNLDSTKHCNSNYASPQGNNTTDISGTNASIAYDNLAVPAAKDTLPGCRFGDCSATAAAIRSLRTGSNATSNCASKYGAQDLAGNVWEWSSDQASCTGAACTGVTGAANTADVTNDDFSGIAFDGVQAPVANNSFTSFGKIQFPVGIPIVSGAFAGDGTVTKTAAQFHSDYFHINVATATRGSRSGGSWNNASFSGRFALRLLSTTTATSNDLGFRCAIAAD